MMTTHRPKKKDGTLGEPQPRKTSALGPVSLRISKEGPEVDSRHGKDLVVFFPRSSFPSLDRNVSTGARHQSGFEEATSTSTTEGDEGRFNLNPWATIPWILSRMSAESGVFVNVELTEELKNSTSREKMVQHLQKVERLYGSSNQSFPKDNLGGRKNLLCVEALWAENILLCGTIGIFGHVQQGWSPGELEAGLVSA